VVDVEWWAVLGKGLDFDYGEVGGDLFEGVEIA
jgi:hypothetical protein